MASLNAVICPDRVFAARLSGNAIESSEESPALRRRAHPRQPREEWEVRQTAMTAEEFQAARAFYLDHRRTRAFAWTPPGEFQHFGTVCPPRAFRFNEFRQTAHGAAEFSIEARIIHLPGVEAPSED